MVYGLGGEAVGLVPVAGPAVQGCHSIGQRLPQAVAQQVGKQVVVAEPKPFSVQRHQEQVGPLQPLQHRLPTASAGNGITQGAGQPVEDRGFQ